jgi:hypothetical protein
MRRQRPARVRLAFWQRRVPPAPVAPPSKWDKWLVYCRVGALVGAVLLLLVSFVPFATEATAPNEGGDISITVEFYTAFEHGGGFITWDFSPATANILRDRVDFNRDGNVSDSEVFGYTGSIDAVLSQDVLVLRNFELAGVRIDTQSGLVGEPVNGSAHAHVRFTFSGQWAQRDADIVLGGDRLATIGFAGNLTPGMRIHERTVIIDGGMASFSGGAHVMRVPAGVAAVATGSWIEGETSDLPRVHFSLFSPVDNSLLLLVPLAIAYFIGVGGARREREATGQARVEPFHKALSAGFLLLLVAYFAAVPGLVMWGAGVLLGIGALLFAYRIYPAERRPDDWKPPQPKPAAEEAPGSDWAPVADERIPLDEAPPAMVDPMPLSEMSRTPSGPDMVPAIAPPTREGRPKIVVSSQPRPAAAAPPPPDEPAREAAPPPKKVRCPGCKMMFEAGGKRPINVTCPHCGRRGVLR